MNFRQTKIVYNSEADSEEILVDVIINLDEVQIIFPGKTQGTITIIMNNKTKYIVKDDITKFINGKKA